MAQPLLDDKILIRLGDTLYGRFQKAKLKKWHIFLFYCAIRFNYSLLKIAMPKSVRHEFVFIELFGHKKSSRQRWNRTQS